MGLLSAIGKKIKSLVDVKTLFFGFEDVKQEPLPLGGAAVTAGRGILGLIKALPSVGKAVKGFATATILGGVLAGGGFALIPKLFGGAKRGTEVLLGDKEIGKEDISDVGKVAALGGVAGLVGAGITLLPRIFGKDEPTLETIPAAVAPINSLPVETDTRGITAEKPVTPETETIEAGVKKKPSKRRSQPRRQTISQRVDVRVGVNAGNRRHIKNIVFA